jgi:hypothetical protein
MMCSALQLYSRAVAYKALFKKCKAQGHVHSCYLLCSLMMHLASIVDALHSVESGLWQHEGHSRLCFGHIKPSFTVVVWWFFVMLVFCFPYYKVAVCYVMPVACMAGCM